MLIPGLQFNYETILNAAKCLDYGIGEKLAKFMESTAAISLQFTIWNAEWNKHGRFSEMEGLDYFKKTLDLEFNFAAEVKCKVSKHSLVESRVVEPLPLANYQELVAFQGGDESNQPSLDVFKVQNNAPKKSYAEMEKEARFQQFDLQTLPVPEKMGDYMAITILTKAYERGLDYCKYAWIGLIDLQKINIEKVRQLVKDFYLLDFPTVKI
ncbi:hypothetical protein Tco_1419925 [Tanacetum coccineum]